MGLFLHLINFFFFFFFLFPSFTMVVVPINKKKSIKKRTNKFIRFQSDRFMRVPTGWRKPKGIDGRVRRRFKGCGRIMPSIGYGTNKRTRHQRPDGFLTFRVNNAKDLDVLLMNNRVYAAEIASSVSKAKRREIVERALELNVKVPNANARLRSEDNE